MHRYDFAYHYTLILNTDKYLSVLERYRYYPISNNAISNPCHRNLILPCTSMAKKWLEPSISFTRGIERLIKRNLDTYSEDLDQHLDMDEKLSSFSVVGKEQPTFAMAQMVGKHDNLTPKLTGEPQRMFRTRFQCPLL